MGVIRQRDATYRLEGDAQMDNTYLGGEQAGRSRAWDRQQSQRVYDVTIGRQPEACPGSLVGVYPTAAAIALARRLSPEDFG
jgi:hypothetical protein